MSKHRLSSGFWTVLYVLSFVAATMVVLGLFPAAFDWIQDIFFTGPNPDAGDVLTGVGALFSAVAFAGILITIVLQSRELALQRAELQETRGELSRQADALELQQFENTFFDMVRLHHEIVRGMVEIRKRPSYMPFGGKRQPDATPDRRFEGRSVLRLILHELKLKIEKHDEKYPNASIEWRAKHAYEAVYDRNGHYLGHYFRNMYHIIKLVDRARIKEKRRYASLLRAQLSGIELELLFFNCVSEHGGGFKEFVHEYAFLEHIPLRGVITPFHLPIYDSRAYGDRKSILILREKVIEGKLIPQATATEETEAKLSDPESATEA